MSGDTLDSIGFLSFENTGSSSATLARIKAVNDSDVPVAFVDFSLEHRNRQNGSINNYGYSTEINSLTINAGSESNGQRNTDDTDQLDLNYRLSVVGAGDVVDTSKLGVEFLPLVLPPPISRKYEEFNPIKLMLITMVVLMSDLPNAGAQSLTMTRVQLFLMSTTTVISLFLT